MTLRPRTFFVIVPLPEGGTAVRDISFKRHPQSGSRLRMYNVFLGHEQLGHVSWLGCDFQGWNAYSHRDLDLLTREQHEKMSELTRRFGKDVPAQPERFREPDIMRVAENFKTRRAAAEYLVRHWGYRDSRIKRDGYY